MQQATFATITQFNIAVFMAAVCGCNYSGCDGELFGADQLRLLDSFAQGGEIFYLYARTTGFHEKVVFFELYNRAPVFNECKDAQIEPAYVIDYNDFPVKQHVKSLTLQPAAAEKLAIVYTQDKSEGYLDVYSVRFSR